LGQALRILELTHKVMQPKKDEPKGSGLGPELPEFIRANQGEAAEDLVRRRT